MGAKLLVNADGANFQAQAVLAMVRYHLGDGIESSWDKEFHRYMAEPQFTRFDNCREQGYTVYMRDRFHDRQINLTFYEHRNSDGIYVQVNNERTFNAPTLNDITKTMQDKYQSAFNTSVGGVDEAARFIVDALKEFWDTNVEKRPLEVIRAENQQRDRDEKRAALLKAVDSLTDFAIREGGIGLSLSGLRAAIEDTNPAEPRQENPVEYIGTSFLELPGASR